MAQFVSEPFSYSLICVVVADVMTGLIVGWYFVDHSLQYACSGKALCAKKREVALWDPHCVDVMKNYHAILLFFPTE